MLSCQQTQNVIDGKKRIILNPSETQKRDFETATFAEDEVYGIDILVSSAEDGKVRLVGLPYLSFLINRRRRHALKTPGRQSTRKKTQLHTSSR